MYARRIGGTYLVLCASVFSYRGSALAQSSQGVVAQTNSALMQPLDVLLELPSALTEEIVVEALGVDASEYSLVDSDYVRKNMRWSIIDARNGSRQLRLQSRMLFREPILEVRVRSQASGQSAVYAILLPAAPQVARGAQAIASIDATAVITLQAPSVTAPIRTRATLVSVATAPSKVAPMEASEPSSKAAVFGMQASSPALQGAADTMQASAAKRSAPTGFGMKASAGIARTASLGSLAPEPLRKPSAQSSSMQASSVKKGKASDFGMQASEPKSAQADAAMRASLGIAKSSSVTSPQPPAQAKPLQASAVKSKAPDHGMQASIGIATSADFDPHGMAKKVVERAPTANSN
jgi:hypothetical protein